MSPNYTTNDPKGWCGDPARGAAMGRPSIHDAKPEGPITLRETVLDSGGYDRNGTYFGQGQALYWYADEDGNVDDVFRHPDELDGFMWEENTQAAASVVRKRYPNATIVIAEPIRPICHGLEDETCGEDISEYNGEYCENCFEREENDG